MRRNSSAQVAIGFLIRRTSGLEVEAIDAEWLAGRAHGVVFSAEELDGGGARELLLWAGWRQALVLIEGSQWDRVLSTASTRFTEITGPVLLVDPDLACGSEPQPLPPEVVEFVAAERRVYVLLGPE